MNHKARTVAATKRSCSNFPLREARWARGPSGCLCEPTTASRSMSHFWWHTAPRWCLSTVLVLKQAHQGEVWSRPTGILGSGFFHQPGKALFVLFWGHTLSPSTSLPRPSFSRSCYLALRSAGPPLPRYISCTFRPVLEKSEPKLMLGDRTLKRHYFLIWSRRKVKNPELVFWKGWVGSQSQQTFMSQHLHKTEVKTVQHRTSWLGDVFQMSI